MLRVRPQRLRPARARRRLGRVAGARAVRRYARAGPRALSVSLSLSLFPHGRRVVEPRRASRAPASVGSVYDKAKKEHDCNNPGLPDPKFKTFGERNMGAIGLRLGTNGSASPADWLLRRAAAKYVEHVTTGLMISHEQPAYRQVLFEAKQADTIKEKLIGNEWCRQKDTKCTLNQCNGKCFLLHSQCHLTDPKKYRGMGPGC